MICREVLNLLPLFFDGELDARQMRNVAMHSSRCSSCEQELRQLEVLQELLANTIQQRVDEVDLGAFWSSIEKKLPVRKSSWLERAQRWWENEVPHWGIRVPALAAAAFVAAMALYLFTQGLEPGSTPEPSRVVVAENNEATIDSVETESDSFAVMNDPETRTTVLWVNDELPLEDVAQ